ncbi:MucBP domain-containing protein [Candidatus Enterococcus ikei]|uniref:MucBP domain-containing protein n=1 Tax=Candidatus Enterococcus ikei TaxID=2815326 RepID=UPI001F5DCCD3|nr:MucBP domain-containing protein [Enterococcus sp. DIV0869a]
MNKKKLLSVNIFILLILGLTIVSEFYFSATNLFAKASVSMEVLEDEIIVDESFYLQINDERDEVGEEVPLDLAKLDVEESSNSNNEQTEAKRKLILVIPDGITFDARLQEALIQEQELSSEQFIFDWDETSRELRIHVPVSKNSVNVALVAQSSETHMLKLFDDRKQEELASLAIVALESDEDPSFDETTDQEENTPTQTVEADLKEENQDLVSEKELYNTEFSDHFQVYTWDQLVQAISNNSITKIILMRDISSVGTNNFASRTENLEINGNGFTLSLNSNSVMLGNLSSGIEKTFHFNNITIPFSNTSTDFIRANDSVAGGRWRILLENTTISGSRRAVDARRSEVTLKGNTYIRTRRSNFALGSFVVEENAHYTSVVFNSNLAAVWFPRNVSGAAVTGTNSEFRVKTDARVNFYRENNVNASQPAVFRHFRTYTIEEGAKVNYFYQNQNGGVAPLGDQSAANGRPQAYTILSGGELNVYTSNQMGIHFRRRDTSLVTETGGKMNVLLLNQNNNIIPGIPVSPDEGGDGDEDDGADGDEDEPDVSLNTLINLAGTRTSISINDPRSLDIRSNAATNLLAISSTSSFSINDANISIWRNSEPFWREPLIVRENVTRYSQQGQVVSTTDSWLMMLNVSVTSNDYKRISAKGTTIYENEQAEITVSYIDESGKIIFPEEMLPGIIDVPTVIESAIPGGLLETSNYTVKNIITTNGRYDEASFEFTPDSSSASLAFILESSDIPVAEGTVEVRYQSIDGVLLASETMTGEVGTQYITEVKNFEGWELVEEPLNATGTFTEETITVTYVYKEVPKQAVLTVQFINELEQLLPGYTVRIETQVGDEIDLTKEQAVVEQLAALVSAGYELSERPDNETAFKIEAAEMTVQYKLQGLLSLVSAPQSIDFGSITYDATTKRVEDPEIDQPLIVADTRADNSNGWTLTAALSSPMKNETGQELRSALRYVYEGQETLLDTNAQMVYLNQEGVSGRFDISDSWGTENGTDGVKLEIGSSEIVHTGSYTGVITWKVMAGQP